MKPAFPDARQRFSMLRRCSLPVPITPPRAYNQTLVVPAGKVRLALRYNDRAIPVPIFDVIGAIEHKYDKEVELDAKAQHEYYVDCIVKTVIIGFGDIDYSITDKATGQIVVETHGKRP
jgi:hypothetical protein